MDSLANFSIGLMVLVLLPVYEGVPVVVMQTFNLQRFCEIIQESKITKAFIVPPVALLLTKAPIVKNYDLSSVRSFTCAAAPLAKELISTFHNTFGVPIVQSYGITEASPAITIQVSTLVPFCLLSLCHGRIYR